MSPGSVVGVMLLLPCVVVALSHRDPEEDQIRSGEGAAGGIESRRQEGELGEEQHLPHGPPKPLEGNLPPLESVDVPTPVSEHRLGKLLLRAAKEKHAAVVKELQSKLVEASGRDLELSPEDRARFGVCSNLDGKTGGRIVTPSALTESFGGDPEKAALYVLHPTKELWEVDGATRRTTLLLHFQLPPPLHSARHELTPTLLFFLEGSVRTGVLSISFSSRSLLPHHQTACLSAGTQFLVLSGGKVPCGARHRLAWQITMETNWGDNGAEASAAEVQRLLKGDKPEDKAPSPLLLLLADRVAADDSDGPEPKHAAALELSHTAAPPPSETFLFLCELQKFLGEALSHTQLEPVPALPASVSLGALTSLPSMRLGSSSSEALLLGLLNSSAPTLFSFPRSASELWAHRGRLTLQPHLLSVLRLRLEETMSRMRREEAGRHGTKEQLLRLQELSALPREGAQPPGGSGNPGERQYHALLLLKALQTVLWTWEAERGQRAARGGQEGQRSRGKCQLHPLTVSMDKYLLSPSTAAINNCQGSCSDLPLERITNHAMMLNIHRNNGLPLERGPCCVPVEYEELCVAVLNSEGTEIQYKPEMVAKECGCR
ncbi:muellerian-inhibiting factor isoform X1 [Scleropages formosus]|uniref:Anti-Mullerian hormone n=1 Tax=Scleropages formosus TaxID=113540 RepID=A0A8C9R4L4_SCLFO|nr:muellerian-inhibiting factor isoform X1 [Scleropages formosus]